MWYIIPILRNFSTSKLCHHNRVCCGYEISHCEHGDMAGCGPSPSEMKPLRFSNSLKWSQSKHCVVCERWSRYKRTLWLWLRIWLWLWIWDPSLPRAELGTLSVISLLISPQVDGLSAVIRRRVRSGCELWVRNLIRLPSYFQGEMYRVDVAQEMERN